MRDTWGVSGQGPVSCVYCGTALDPGARFCGACGNPIPHTPNTPAAFANSGDVTVPGASTRADSHSETIADTRSPLLPSIPPDDPYIGTTLKGRFKIESKLGEGGFGAVYRGVQTGTGRVVAIKLLHPEMTRDKNVVARFRREGQVLCNLRDAHTITTYDFDQTEDGTLFIAMELLEGRSLHDVFHSEAPVDWRRMIKIISECCSSLAEAHAQGIIHRDLKPENIHLEKRSGNPEFVKILDFGIAKVVHGDGFGRSDQPQLTATGQTLGTLEYMSPEQLMGKQLDGRSDVYGLGVVAYELMTGQLPFPDATGPAQLIAAQLKKVPRMPSRVNPSVQIPPEVDALILRMLEKHRDNRHADVDALREACGEILAGGSNPKLSVPPVGLASGPATSGSFPHNQPMPGNTPPPGSMPRPVGVGPSQPPPMMQSADQSMQSMPPGLAGTSGSHPMNRGHLARRRSNNTIWIIVAIVGIAGLAAVAAILAMS